MRRSLQLQPNAASQHATEHVPVAWLLPAAQPQVWLTELCAWGISLGGVRLYLVPSSAAPAIAGSVLVIPPVGSVPRVSPLAQPYRVRAQRCYVPCGAELCPAVSDLELQTALPAAVVLVHPALGWLRWETDEALTPSDLFAPPRELATDWTRAQPGTPPRPLLTRAEPLVPPHAQTLLLAGGDGIGEGKLPPEGEGQGGVRDKLRGAMEWLAGKLPGSEQKSGLLGDVRSWLAQAAARLEDSISQARQKEIDRLLHLLRTNPDEGLRFAIPFGGGMGRGMTTPSGMLGPRNTDFNLQRLGGGGPVDPWFLSSQQQQALADLYREAAQREIRIGRFRRAAYIYAELLDDLATAAKVLEDGHHFREAAVLYRDRLNQPRQAAQCLERGGLLEEAAGAFEVLGEDEHAGDLYRRLEQPVPAEAAYRRAVGKLLAAHDYLAAARLLEEKLTVPEEALTTLASGWPASAQAVACLEGQFALLGRLARHADATRLLQTTTAKLPTVRDALPLARVLTGVAQTYPDAPFRRQAADRTRVLVGKTLPSARSNEVEQLARCVVDLAAHDRLLARDAASYREQRVQRAKRPAPVRSKRLPLSTVSVFRLPPDVEWEVVTASRHFLLAAGWVQKELVCSQASWSGLHRELYVPLLRMLANPTFSIEMDSGRSKLMHVLPEVARPAARIELLPDHGGYRPTLVRLGKQAFPRLEFSFEEPTFLRHRLEGVPESAYEAHALARSDFGMLVKLVTRADGLVVEASLPDGPHLFAVRLGDVSIPPGTEPVLLARAGRVFVGIGTQLLMCWEPGVLFRSEFDQVLERCDFFPLGESSVLAVAGDHGGHVLWPQHPNDYSPVAFATDLRSPRITFTRSGHLVAIDRDALEVYECTAGSVRCLGRGPGRRDLLAVLPADAHDRFALVTQTGEVEVLQFTPGDGV